MPSYVPMFAASFKALADVLSPDFRGVLWKAIGLSLLLFVTLFAAIEAAFWFLTLFPWPWVETIAAIGAGLGLLVLFFFLMAPVTALFAGLYLDVVSAKVEQKHYAGDVPGKALPTLKALVVGLQFGLLVLAINILALPLVFTGFGAIALIVINAYLLSREYFEMAAMRHLERQEAKDLREQNAFQVFVAGLLPAAMALVPFLNLLVPIFSTSYFLHLFKRVQRSSV
jgi:CysZ protein